MSTQEIASRLIELVRQQQFTQAQGELFAEEAINREPETSLAKSADGLRAILMKEEQFLARIQTWHRLEISEPLVTDSFFALRMVTDVTLTNQQHLCLDELCLYEVRNGKIIKEQFFY